ncbi:hypothetical protein D3C73_1425770 [compost metagenome]
MINIPVFVVDIGAKAMDSGPKISIENFKYIHNFMRNRIYTYDILLFVLRHA